MTFQCLIERVKVKLACENNENNPRFRVLKLMEELAMQKQVMEEGGGGGLAYMYMQS